MGKWTRASLALLCLGLGAGGWALASGFSGGDAPTARLGMPYVDSTPDAVIQQVQTPSIGPTVSLAPGQPFQEPMVEPIAPSGMRTREIPSEPNVTRTFVPNATPQEQVVMGPRVIYDNAEWSVVHQEMGWVRGEYGLWQLQGGRLPSLFTTSPAGTPQISAGVLGQPTTTVLLGGERLVEDHRSGGQLTAGAWLDNHQVYAIEGSLMIIESQGQQATIGSDGTQIIARPFLDAQTGLESAQFVSFPNLVAGSATVVYRSDPLYGANLDLKKTISCGCDRRVFLLGGYRFLRFDEDLFINEDLISLEAATLGTTLVVRDSFSTRNEFHGGEIGIQAQMWRQRWSLDFLAKLAVGNVRRRVIIDGSTVVTAPGDVPAISEGGFAALSSNIGTHTSNAISLVPELSLTAGWQVTPNLRATVGYTVFLWTNIVRPGDQLDHTINPSLLPPSGLVGPARPILTLRDSDMWAHGVRFGLEYRY